MTLTLTSCAVREIPAPSEINAPDFKTYVFAGSVPEEFSAAAHSNLSISDKYWRINADRNNSDKTRTSLRWDWEAPGASITFKHPEAFKRLTGEKPDPIVYDYVTCTTISSFSLWVFNETPSQDPLFFEIGDGKTVDCRFWMNLNFSGWKELAFLYGRDLIGFPNQQTADTLRVIAPNGIPGISGAENTHGSLYFSHFSPRRESDVRFIGNSDVAPWVGSKSVNRAWSVGRIGAGAKTIIPLPDTISDSQMEIMRALSVAYLGDLPKITPRKVSADEVEKLRTRIVEKYGIKREGRFVSGSAGANSNYGFPGDATAVANLYLAAQGQTEIENILFQLFADMMALDGYGVGGYFWRDAIIRPLYLMKEPLKRKGEWERVYARIAPSAAGLHDQKPGSNADVFNTYLYGILGVVFLRDDGPEKWRDLMALRHWLDACSEYGCIQSDGTFMHHGMIYSGYNYPALPPLAKTLALLHGTPFEAAEMERIAKRSAYAMCFYTQTPSPHFFAGRGRSTSELGWGFVKNAIIPLAKCGSPIDKEMAGVALICASLYLKESVGDPDLENFRKLGVAPSKLEGHLPLNYACAGIQRRGDWTLVVRGQKKGFPVNEAYPMGGENTMGRFVNYGQIVLTSPETLNFTYNPWKPDSGTSQGWNWALWTGATTRLLPHDALRSRFEVDESLTSEPFCGDTGMDGDGVWGMKLQEELPGSIDPCRIGPVKYWLGDKLYTQLIKDGHYDKEFRARKSVFMFGDRVVCLGSGVKSSDEYPAVTTLFQNSLAQEGRREKFVMSGKLDAVFPLEKDLGQPCWLIDSNGVGYYVPSGNGRLRIERKLQKLPFHIYWNLHKPELQEKIAANEGETEYAYLDHGDRPDDGYEYAMLINATPERMTAFARMKDPSDRSDPTDPTDLPYQALRRDNTAHIVKDSATGKTGYVIFEAGDLGLETGNSKLDKSGTVEAMTQEARTSNQASSNQSQVSSFIRSASAPCVVMMRDSGDGKRKLSYCNPDLGRQYANCGSSGETEQVATLALAGSWKIAVESKEAKAETKDGATILTFRTFGAKPAMIELVRE